MTTGSSTSAKGFFGSLFDFSFSSYVTPKLIKIIYAIVMVVSALGALFFVVAAFRANAAVGVVVLVIVAPIVFLFYVILYRVMLEVVMAVFRIAENTSIMADAVAPARPPIAGPGPVAAPGWGGGAPPTPPTPPPPPPAGTWGGGFGPAPGPPTEPPT